MKKIIPVFIFTALAAPSAPASETAAYAAAKAVINLEAAPPAEFSAEPAVSPQTGAQPAMPVTDKNLYLLADCTGTAVIGYPDTKEQYERFHARHAAVLSAAGLKIKSDSFSPGLAVISYDSPDGLALRRFIGEKLKYDGSSDAGIAAAKDEIKAVLAKNGLPVAAEYFPVRTSGMRPTFALYYLAKPAQKPKDEILLRLLTAGEDIDYDILSGVNIVRRDGPQKMAYIGPEIGYIGGIGKTEAEARRKLKESEEYFAGNGAKIIGSRIVKLDWPSMPEYKYGYHLYIYR
ncbi:MAG: hypothetical protein WC421_00525 [Elusimicrobiales bacterium]